MMQRLRLALLAGVLAAAARTGPAQDDTPHDPALQRAVEAYFAEPGESKAAEQLEEILARPLPAVQVLAAVRRSVGPIERRMTITVPHRGQALAATITTPEGHSRRGPRLPVVLDVSGGHNLGSLGLTGVVTVHVEGYTPPQFSDEGRDGFLKVLRLAAHRAHGDPDRLWAVGYSWAAHACYDVAMHRPGTLRGLVPLAGGPRRRHFRLLPNLRGVKIFAFCGGKDDRELVWNLREVAVRRKKLGLSYTVAFDLTRGHSGPFKGVREVGGRLVGVPPREPAGDDSGRLLADAALVETPLLRLDRVDERRVAVPRAIPVSPGLSFDGKRRATIKAMRRAVVRVDWKIRASKSAFEVTLRPSGVEEATVFLRAPRFAPGRKVRVRWAGRTVFNEVVSIDPRLVLQDARRCGDRLRPAIATASTAR